MNVKIFYIQNHSKYKPVTIMNKQTLHIRLFKVFIGFHLAFKLIEKGYQLLV